MKNVWYGSSCAALCLTALILFSGCSVSDHTLTQAEQRIDALKAKGVPDSALSRAIVFQYQAKDAKTRGNRSLARQAADSMQILIARAEAYYIKHIEDLKPVVNSLLADIKRETADFTGLQKAKVDSIMTIMDSFIKINWILQAESQSRELVTMLPGLKFDEKRATELRGRLPGTWTCVQTKKGGEDVKYTAVEKQVFTFRNDGTASFVQSGNGQQTPTMKTDYEFANTGTYDLAGDTIKLSITNYKQNKQIVESLFMDPKTRKTRWERDVKQPYDSLITDGSQDLWITFTDLNADFSKR